ncbi:hypothetical protein L210DRAFT_3574501 [Boletus edulis BED1]|uniref:C2H2-type domain-containing protein n=1 Tax=Boletus edulis BED1 TaxID=1328754 RepID=A0AAD4BCL0_BOLED|nr:hypothetical protein L210DRAFT_3574501 [Boletus edulis BED1]
MASGTRFPLAFMLESRVSPGVPFATDGTPTHRTAPEPRVLPHSQTIQHSNPGTSHHASLGINATFPPSHLSPGYHFAHQPDRPALATGNVSIPSSSGPTGDVRRFSHNEQRAPIVIYRPPEKKSPRGRQAQRACAINIEGVLIDEDDLYAGARQGSGIISVHECQWAKSSDPCGMWIIGTRSCIGAHISKWHPQSRVDSRVRCLWDGCTTRKAMLTGSINRHVVTVHLEEAFHCQRCNQEFSRQDVYNKHLESSEVCREAGAGIVYGTERREIDTRQVLQRGFSGDAIRHAGR